VKVSAALPTGVAALLFESARARRRLEGRLAALVEGHGYAEAILPILDYLEPYEALLTPASRGELYRFIDRDGEQLALRADFTPMLARLLAPRLGSLRLPLRLFYRGDVVRYEESRPGSRRELYQMGVELLGMAGAVPGEPAEEAEREVLGLFLEALAGGGGGPRQVVLGLAGILDAALLAAAGGGSRGGVAGTAATAAAVARRERSVVRQACPALLPIVETGLPERPEDLGPAAAARLRWLLALRDELAARFPAVQLSVDLAEFARFSRHPDLAAEAGARSYYDGLVFRAYAGAAAVPVGGGGCYGSLFRALGADIDAVGFSLNLDGLLEAGEEEGAEAFLPAAAFQSPRLVAGGLVAGGEEGGPREADLLPPADLVAEGLVAGGGGGGPRAADLLPPADLWASRGSPPSHPLEPRPKGGRGQEIRSPRPGRRGTPEVVRVALPKGRNLEPAVAALRAAGLGLAGYEAGGRSLRTVLPEDGVEMLSLKDWDLPLYVEHGVADCGIVGSDVLGELDGDLLVPARLAAGRCRFALIGRSPELPAAGCQVRLATKYPLTARRLVAGRAWGAEIVRLSGSVELAPALRLAELALDLVQTGRTLADNGLVEIEAVAEVAPCLVVNRASFQRHRARINAWLDRMEAAGAVG
jgi:ATP phosphoribosyltransferase